MCNENAQKVLSVGVTVATTVIAAIWLSTPKSPKRPLRCSRNGEVLTAKRIAMLQGDNRIGEQGDNLKKLLDEIRKHKQMVLGLMNKHLAAKPQLESYLLYWMQKVEDYGATATKALKGNDRFNQYSSAAFLEQKNEYMYFWMYIIQECLFLSTARK
jgi:hypothetical protein